MCNDSPQPQSDWHPISQTSLQFLVYNGVGIRLHPVNSMKNLRKALSIDCILATVEKEPALWKVL
jgi:hypothetical protein